MGRRVSVPATTAAGQLLREAPTGCLAGSRRARSFRDSLFRVPRSALRVRQTGIPICWSRWAIAGRPMCTSSTWARSPCARPPPTSSGGCSCRSAETRAERGRGVPGRGRALAGAVLGLAGVGLGGLAGQRGPAGAVAGSGRGFRRANCSRPRGGPAPDLAALGNAPGHRAAERRSPARPAAEPQRRADRRHPGALSLARCRAGRGVL